MSLKHGYRRPQLSPYTMSKISVSHNFTLPIRRDISYQRILIFYGMEFCHMTKSNIFLDLKLTCHHINRRHICFNIRSISVHPFLWMNGMLVCICMVFAEMLSTGYKRKIPNYNVCLRRQNELATPCFPACPSYHSAIRAVDDM